MKPATICLVLLLFSCRLLAQEPAPDCSAFHTGDYLYTDSTGDTWELKRKKNMQSERNKRTGHIVKHKIVWISDCEYRLTQTWTNDRNRRKFNRNQFSYRIISTTPNSFSYSCACKDIPIAAGTVVRAMN